MRVLVVEDDQEISQVLQRSLRMEGYRRQGHRRRRQGARRDAGLPARPDRARPRPRDGRHRGHRHLRRDDDTPILAHRARCARLARRARRRRRRQLFSVKPFERQELLARMRALLPKAPGWRRCGRGPHAQPRHARGRARRAQDQPRPARVRAARVPDAQRAPRDFPAAAARRGLGLRPLLHHEHDRGLRLEPPQKLEAGGEPRLLHTVRGAGLRPPPYKHLPIRWRLGRQLLRR